MLQKIVITENKLKELENIDTYSKTDSVYVAVDAEWDTSNNKPDVTGGIARKYSDVISVQIAIKAQGKPLYECLLLRNIKDRVFQFDDLFKVVREYFKDNDIPTKRVTNKNGRFKSGNKTVNVYPFVLAGFFMGVDVSVFKDWNTILKSNKDCLVNLRQQAIATTSDIAISCNTRSKNAKKKGQQGKYAKNYALVTIRDMILLAPPKANLDKLGQMIDYPKLDTEQWDQEGYSCNGCYTFYPKGFYKSHMRVLLDQRYDDFVDYAMTDSEIVLGYINQLFGMLAGLDMLDDKTREILPFASGSLSAKVSKTYSNKSNMMICRQLWHALHYDPNLKKATINHVNKGILKSLVKVVKTNNKHEPLYEIEGSESADKLATMLDWDKLRKGYYEPLDAVVTDKKHRQGQTDIASIEPLTDNEAMFETANKAYYGGHNVAYTHGFVPGKIAHRKFIDIDAKSAYNTGGHLMPDFEAGVGVYEDRNITINRLYIQWLKNNFNGVFTIGFCECEIRYNLSKQHYNFDQRFILTPYRSSAKDTPRYVQYAGDDHINPDRRHGFITLTDAINAYENGAEVFCQRVYIPVQDRLNEGVKDGHYMDHCFPTGVAQDVFAQYRAMYPKSNPLNSLYKMLGNSVYGKTGQGLHASTKKSYQDGYQYYLPLSEISNPAVAAQYTAITRYIVMRLIKVAEQVEPSLKVESITTDGFLCSVDLDLDVDQFEKKLQKALLKEDQRWVYVAHTYFNDEFYENKGTTICDLFDVRTRFQITFDACIHALAGIKNRTPQEVYDALIHKLLKLDMEQHRLSSLTDEKHNATYKKLLHDFNFEVTGYLNYDFTRKLTTFHAYDNGLGYWDTAPFESVDELVEYRSYALMLSRNWCIYDVTNAKLFQRCMDQLMDGAKDTSYKLADRDHLYENENYIQEHLLRYFAAWKPDIDRHMIYDLYFDGGKYADYKSFTQVFSRRVNQMKNKHMFINYLAIRDYIEKLPK